MAGAAVSGSDLCRYLRRRPSASLGSLAANDIIEFGSNRRGAFAAVINQQAAFAFVPREAEYNSGGAAAQEAQYEGAEKSDEAHGVHPSGVVKQSSPDTHARTDIGVRRRFTNRRRRKVHKFAQLALAGARRGGILCLTKSGRLCICQPLQSGAPGWLSLPRRRAPSFMEWPAPPSGVVGSSAVQEEEWEWISLSLASIWARTFAAVESGSTHPARSAMRRKVRRETLIALAEKLPACIVGMEACCGAHHLGRAFAAHGHAADVALNMFGPTSRPRRTTIATPRGSRKRRGRPTMRFVELKSQDQLDMQTCIRSRDRLVGERTAVINQLRAIVLERGMVAPPGQTEARAVP